MSTEYITGRKDNFERAGDFFLKGPRLAFGRFVKVTDREELPVRKITRVVAVIFTLLLLPIALTLATIGFVYTHFSATYKKNQMNFPTPMMKGRPAESDKTVPGGEHVEAAAWLTKQACGDQLNPTVTEVLSYLPPQERETIRNLHPYFHNATHHGLALKPVLTRKELIQVMAYYKVSDTKCPHGFLRDLKTLNWFVGSSGDRFSSKKLKEIIDFLEVAAPNLFTLNLSNTDLKDSDLGELPLTRSLKKLDLSKNRRITGSGFASLRVELSCLEELNLSNTGFKGDQLEELPLRLVSLKKLDLSNNKHLAGTGFVSFGVKLSCLEELVLSGIGLTNTDLEQFPLLPNLKKLDVSGNKEISGSSLVNLSGILNMTELNLSNTGFKSDDLAYVYPLRDLKKLDVSQNEFSAVAIIPLTLLPSLTELMLPACNINAAARSHLNLLRLQRNRIGHTLRIDDDTLPLAELPRLLEFRSSTLGTPTSWGYDLAGAIRFKRTGRAFDDETLSMLALKSKLTGSELVQMMTYLELNGKECPNLEKLSEADLSECEFGLQKLKEIINFLKNAAPNLSVLNLSNAGITNDGLKELLSLLPNLEKLDLSRNGMISGPGLSCIGELDKLKELNLSRIDITDADLISFVIPPNLEKLDLSRNGKIYGFGLRSLSPLHKIMSQGSATKTQESWVSRGYNAVAGLVFGVSPHAVALNGLAELMPTQLRELDLTNTGISVGFSKYLSWLRQLTKLDLSGPEVTAADVEHLLTKLPSLKALSLTKTSKITEAELASLREQWPGVCLEKKGRLSRSPLLRQPENMPTMDNGLG